MWIVKASIGNVHFVIVVALMILVLGGVALSSIPVDILPAFKTPAVQVLTFYNGMPADSVESTITNRVERWVNQAPGAAIVESRSMPGVSVVRVFFRDDIDPASALTLTNSLALGTLPTLPPGTLPPVVLPFDPTGTLPLGILTVSNPRLGEATVKDIARITVRNQLGSVKGSVAPVVVGGKDRAIIAYTDPDELQSHQLSLMDVARSIADGNLMVTPGTAYFGNEQVLLGTNAMFNRVAEFNRLPLRLGSQQVLLEDVGSVEDSAAIQTSRVRVNGRPQVFVPIYRQGGASSLDVAAGVREAIPQIESQLPEGTKLDFVIDQSEFVRKAIESLLHEGAIGIVLVSLMILIFLGNLRMTFIAVLALPLSVLCSVIGLHATGNTINVMTLAGMFLAIGPLVDNAIVVLENTHRHLGMGKKAVQAAYDAATELTLPVLLATCSTIIVLLPLAFSPGISGFLFRPLTLAVAFAMIASFALSWTLVPSLCAKLLRSHSSSHSSDDPHALESQGIWHRLHHRIQQALQTLNHAYERILQIALRHRRKVLLGVVCLFCGSLLQLYGIGQEFFPQNDAGQMTLYVRAPSSSRLDATEHLIEGVEAFLKEQIPERERKMIVSEIGVNPDWSAAYTANAGQMDAVIRVQFTEDRRYTAQEYAIRLRRAFNSDPRFEGKLEAAFDTGGMVSAALNFGASSPIDITITGGKPREAMDLAYRIRARVRQIPGAADVRVLQRLDARYLRLEVNRELAATVGLSARDVIQQVVAAMNSSMSLQRTFWIDSETGNQYFVAVQYPEDPQRNLDSLKTVVATGSKSNQPVYLSSLVSFVDDSAPVEITHSALKRTINVQVNTENRDIGSLANEIHCALQEIPVPKGMMVELRGEYARMKESFRNLSGGLALAAVLVFLLMAPLFRSFVMPLIILFTIPLGLIGVLTTLYATKTTLNVQSEMGVIFLIGIVVSNGVLLLDFANQQRKAGLSVHDAIVRAAAIRFRPILMTFLATFLDLLPLAIGMGKGSESITPLARAVVGGLLTSTMLTLLVVPILYTMLIRDKKSVPSEETLEGSTERLTLPSPNEEKSS